MTYLSDVLQSTPTRFWVNNPTLADSMAAQQAGAFGVTTNPAFCSKLLQTEQDHIQRIIAGVVADEPDNSAAAERVYHLASKALMEQWLPVYERSGGEAGFVTIQEDPRREEDTAYILEASLRAAELAPNYMAKVPVTGPGLKVIRELVAHDIPICATEVFSIAQYEAAMEVYAEASSRSGKAPAYYVTHITGISDEYWGGVAKSEGVDLSEALLAKAGTVVGMHELERSKDGQRPSHRLIGGGARGLHHFTNYVGHDMDITINWSTAVELDEAYAGAGDTSYEGPSEEEVAQLRDKLPNFARAHDVDGVALDEFADFGPVMLFRTQFMNGYSRLLDAVAEARR